MKSESVTDVTDHTYKTVTRAHVRACGADREPSVTSVTPVTHPPVPMREGSGLLPCILALDLGTSTGWAIRGHDGLITSGTVSLRPGRFDGGGMRYLRFTNWLTEIDRLSGPVAAIWFEEVRRHAGTDASRQGRHGRRRPRPRLQPGRRQRGRRHRAPALGDRDEGRCRMRWHPHGYGGRRRDPEQVKREGWREQGVLAVSADDDRLTWPERELVRQLGEKLYGPRPSDREARHG